MLPIAETAALTSYEWWCSNPATFLVASQLVVELHRDAEELQTVQYVLCLIVFLVLWRLQQGLMVIGTMQCVLASGVTVVVAS